MSSVILNNIIAGQNGSNLITPQKCFVSDRALGQLEIRYYHCCIITVCEGHFSPPGQEIHALTWHSTARLCDLIHER